MGLPDEGFGLSKKRFRLGLNSKRKGSHKELCVGEDQSSIMIRSSNDMTATATTHHAFIAKEGKNQAYVDNDQNKEPLVSPVASLYNIGNTCYLNCMIQTLRYTPGFVKNLSELKDRIRAEESRFKRKDEGNVTQKTSVWKLVESLDDLFRHMRYRESEYKDLCPTDSDTMSIRPDVLLDHIRKFNPIFEENSQHDAQELLRCLLSCLDDAETELEKVQADRLQTKIEEKNTSVPDDKDKSEEIFENVVEKSGAIASKSNKRRGSKRKIGQNEQEFGNQLSPVMRNFLHKKRLPQTQANEEEIKDVDCNAINEVRKCGDAGMNEVVVKASHDKETETKFNCSSDDKGCIDMKNLDPNLRERKPLRLGIKGTKGLVESEAIIISSGDEESDLETSHTKKNSASSARKSPLSKDITEITEHPVLVSPFQKKSLKSEKNYNKQFISDAEDSLLSTEQNGNQHMISPGKHLTIHSPLSKDGRHTTFLRAQSHDPISAQTLSISASQSISLSQHSPQNVFQSSAVLEGDSAAKLPSQCQYEAKLKLKRCDWLGVSPVKSISANLVLERMKGASPSKRKLNFEATETVGTTSKMSKNENNCKLSTDEWKFDPNDHKKDTLENTIPDYKNVTGNTSQRKIVSGENANNNLPDFSTEYKGCKMKPLSVRLRKLEWLGADSKERSFNLREILKKDKKEILTPVSSKDGDYHDKMVKRDERVSDNDAGCQYLQGESKSNHVKEKLVQGLFGGVMGHRTCCCQCEKTSNRSETFLDVSIPVRILSSHDNSKSSDEDEDDDDMDSKNSCVFKLLKSLSTRERLCNDNKYFCDHCFSLVEAERFCFFQDLPKVLAIHLKRFDAGLGSLTGYVSKISDHVSVPEHLPCLIPACKDSDCEHRYSLYAVVTHSGSSILHGHYRSYVKVSSSFNKQLFSYMNQNETNNHQQQSLSSSTHNFSQSSSPGRNDNPIIGNNASSATSLIGNTVEDITDDSFVYAKQLQSIFDKRCDNSDGLASMSSKCGMDVETREEKEMEKKSWWLECDDESVRVFEDEEFQDKLLEDVSSLLGTPYILFYHQKFASI